MTTLTEALTDTRSAMLEAENEAATLRARLAVLREIERGEDGTPRMVVRDLWADQNRLGGVEERPLWFGEHAVDCNPQRWAEVCRVDAIGRVSLDAGLTWSELAS